MRIAIDARELIGRVTGVGRYLSEILSAWCELAEAAPHEFVLCAPEPIDVSRWRPLSITSLDAPGGGTMWEQRALPRLLRRAQPDLLWAPAYTGPIWSPVPMVVTIHDVSFAAHPEWFSWREGMRRRLMTRLAARRARRVLTDSGFSKQEIERHLHIAGEKVEVIYPGVRPASSAAPRDASSPVVLFVGSIFNRRHVPELIEGFALLAQRRQDVQLEIVGDNRTHPRVDIDALAASRAPARIRVRSYVSDAELTSLYANAAAFAFLSDYEGFGLTPLEALAAGVPAVVLDTPIAREVYGPAAVYVPAPEPTAIAVALERVLFDADERARLNDAAGTILPRYSWHECARQTLRALVRVRREP